MEKDTFPVLVTSRDEIAEAVRAGQGSLLSHEENEREALAVKVSEASDDDLAYVARKAGDYLMEGGDYFGALVGAADGYFAG